MRKSPEIGSGHHTTYFRELDGRMGRWWSADPITFPHQSPYNTFDGNPIYYTDASGASVGYPEKEESYKATVSTEISSTSFARSYVALLSDIVTPPEEGSQEEADLNRGLENPEFRAYYNILNASRNVYTYRRVDDDGKAVKTGENEDGSYNIEIRYNIKEIDNWYGLPRYYAFFEETAHLVDYEGGRYRMFFQDDGELGVGGGPTYANQLFQQYLADPSLTRQEARNRALTEYRDGQITNFIESEVSAKLFAMRYAGPAQITTTLSSTGVNIFRGLDMGRTFVEGVEINLTNSFGAQVQDLLVNPTEENVLEAKRLLRSVDFENDYRVEFTWGRRGEGEVNLAPVYRAVIGNRN
ncbi:hypothetical protein SapgrDRAFT_0224 [Saprospira grandis DSM 2844]|uniref:RHS repeat-associated core domain protein n=1 Tax=Saprospira grandis DSM 2844 TaxID=694433 RepID=J0P3I7_9BACT|nr:hypothetical protein [Saprospira grandis]EJF51977.1 hypothetical protein SapgrDRAFT_0224 [Saprospira grandis DSM 2844]